MKFRGSACSLLTRTAASYTRAYKKQHEMYPVQDEFSCDEFSCDGSMSKGHREI